MQPESSKSTGPTSDDGETCEAFRNATATNASHCGKSTCCAVGSLAKISVSPEKAPESKANEAVCGESFTESFAFYDHNSSSWKTSQRCLFGGLMSFSEIWPRAGTMRSGMCSQRQTLARRTSESACSFWPTPNVSGYRSDGELRCLQRKTSPEEFRGMTERAASIEETSMDADTNGTRLGKQRRTIAVREKQFAVERSGWWKTEPQVGRVANGIPGRVGRLRGLGNAVVPQVAQWIGERIVKAMGEENSNNE